MAKDPSKAFNQDGSLNEDAVAALSKALSTADKSTFSYLEFRLAAKQLMANGQDQQQAFESVFTTAFTIGVDREALALSAEAYLKTLESEHEKFAQAMEKRMTAGVAADQSKIDKVIQAIAKLTEQKATIEAKLSDAEAKKIELEEALKNVQERVLDRGKHMIAAYEAMHSEIKSDFEGMTTNYKK
ncbi:MAG: hypothetical protein AB8F78_11000 [Saprospiraceae bacterium]